MGSAASLIFLLTFALVNLSVIALRRKAPEIDRKYKVPLYPLTPILGIVLNVFLALYQFTFQPIAWYITGAWVVLGLLLYYGYFDKLAEDVEPFVVELDRAHYTEWSGYGILALNVRETRTLRELHNRINTELARLFENTSSAHDGDCYRFHLTIELGKTAGENAYKRYYEELAGKEVNLSFTAREMALFYYDDDPCAGSFMTYKVLELGSRPGAGAC